MAESKTEKDLLPIFVNIEKAIGDQLHTMLQNDAMLSLNWELRAVAAAVPEHLLKEHAGPCMVISSTISWQNAEPNIFFLEQDTAKALLSKITEANEAIDDLQVVLDNWQVAMGSVLSQHLKEPPTFEPPTSETRPLSADDFLPEALLFTYEMQLADFKAEIYRIAPPSWQQIIEAANLEVTEVDDVEEHIPDIDSPELEIENVEFGSLDENSPEKTLPGGGSIEMLYDLRLDLVVELGRTKKPIREILDLGRGSIIELEKLAGDPLDIYVNDKKLAEGEVVVVDDHFGIRITNLVRPEERVRSLGA